MLYLALTAPEYVNNLLVILKSSVSIQDKTSVGKEGHRSRVTEFMLTIHGLALSYAMMTTNSQMVIVTGPNQELAIKLINRMKTLFEPHGIIFD